MLNHRAYLFILFSFFVVLSSWIRWYSTETLKADENFILESNVSLWSCVFFYHIGIFGMMYILYQIVCQKPNYKISKVQTIKISLFSMFLFFLMTVMFASDIYTYLAEGELWTRGIFTYTNGELIKQSRFIEYVSDWWKDCPNHYGAPLLFLFGISCYFGHTIFKSYVFFKLLIFFIGLMLLYVVSKLESTIYKSQYNFFALIVLSPILMIEGIGQAHAEIVITLLLAATMLAMHHKKIFLAAIFIGIAIACKILYIVILLPLFLSLIYVYNKSEQSNWKTKVKDLVISLGLIALVIFISYIPIWQGIETITNPIAYHGTKTPSRSYTEILILFHRYWSDIVQNGANITELIKRAQMPNFLPVSKVLYLKDKIAPFFAWFGLVLAAWNLLPLIRAEKVNSVYYYFAKLWIIIIVIYSPIFNPWYFMPILMLMFYHRKSSWIFYLVFVTSLSINYQIGNTTPPDSVLNVLVSVNMVLMLVMFLYKFKTHFIAEPYHELKIIASKLPFINKQ